jgi:hypothetical protein
MAKSIKLKPELWDRITKYAAKAGYSAPEEFVEHVLDRELAKLEEALKRDEVDRRLRGLGYLE